LVHDPVELAELPPEEVEDGVLDLRSKGALQLLFGNETG
jgi:hypothetical protein